MPTYEERLQTDPVVRRLQQEYDEQWARYQSAFAQDWPNKSEVEQEVARRGRLVSDRWEELRRLSRGEGLTGQTA